MRIVSLCFAVLCGHIQVSAGQDNRLPQRQAFAPVIRQGMTSSRMAQYDHDARVHHQARRFAEPLRQGGGMSLASSSYSYPLLGAFWTISMIFLWAIWFWILITIFIEIFRSHDLPGWAKALWFILILFLPLIGVVVYLIVGGSEMAFFKNRDPEFRLRLHVAIVAYSVSAIFGVAFLLTRVTAPHTTPLLALSVAIGASAPLALAFLWGQLTALKIGPVQIDLTQITVPLVNPDLADAVREVLTDATPDLTKKVLELIETPVTKLVKVNLPAQEYWWPSRLFFLAVLLDDYTDIRRVVFVTGDDRKDYIGMARPHVIRRCIAAARPEGRYEEVYQKAEALTDNNVSKNLPDPVFRQTQVQVIAQMWGQAYQAVHPSPDPTVPVAERPSPGQFVTAQELRRILGNGLSTTFVEWDGEPGVTSDYYRILYAGEEFVALTSHMQTKTGQPRLDIVVNASRMAIDISRQVLRRQLERRR